VFVSLGGSTVIILGLSKWFGDVFAQKLILSFKNKHEKDLEDLKSGYQKELESTKVELDKAKSQFLRYTEKQFELYNDLWKVLLYTKNQADSLWEVANPDQIPSFSEQIKLSKDAIDDNMLLIEESHYEKLMVLIKQFEQFQFGKIRLVDLRGQTPEKIIELGLTKEQIQQTIGLNKSIKDNYDNLIMEIGKSFREQIKG